MADHAKRVVGPDGLELKLASPVPLRDPGLLNEPTVVVLEPLVIAIVVAGVGRPSIAACAAAVTTAAAAATADMLPGVRVMMPICPVCRPLTHLVYYYPGRSRGLGSVGKMDGGRTRIRRWRLIGSRGLTVYGSV